MGKRNFNAEDAEKRQEKRRGRTGGGKKRAGRGDFKRLFCGFLKEWRQNPVVDQKCFSLHMASSKLPRSRRAILPVWLFMVGWVGLAAPGLRAAADAPAELILRGAATGGDKAKEKGQEILTPSAAFELRCAEPMVAPERVGTEEKESPIVLIPPLAGSFRWTSQRGGVFTPSAPPALGTVFHAVVRPHLLKADGQPLGADEVHATYYAPPMEARFGGFLGAFDKKDLAARPKVQLFFNAAVDPDQLAPFLKFQDAAGNTVPATAALPGKNDGAPPETTTPHRTWKELFFAAHAPADDKVKTAPVVNRVVVTPAEALPVGEKWTLVVAPGLPSTEAGVKVPEAAKFVVGNVRPFAVSEVKTVKTTARTAGRSP